jgi:hypothetical protein
MRDKHHVCADPADEIRLDQIKKVRDHARMQGCIHLIQQN